MYILFTRRNMTGLMHPLAQTPFGMPAVEAGTTDADTFIRRNKTTSQRCPVRPAAGYLRDNNVPEQSTPRDASTAAQTTTPAHSPVAT